MRSAVAATALGITLTLAALSSCAGSHSPVQPPDPNPSLTPMFASDEEALAAAEEVYGRYLDVSDSVGASGWNDLSGLESVARDDALSDATRSAAEYAAKGWRQVGVTTFDSMVLQQSRDTGAGSIALVVYVCLDVTAADIVDKGGKSVVSTQRSDRLALEVGMDDLDGALKIDRSETWSGQNFC